MKLKSWSLNSFLMLVALIVIGCSSTPLLRYGNRAPCVGHFHDFPEEKYIRRYPIPVQAEYADMTIRWHEASSAFVLNDAKMVLHVIDRTGAVQFEQDNSIPFRRGGGLALSPKYHLAAFKLGTDSSATVYVYSFEKEASVEPVATIERLVGPVFHPGELLLAGQYFSEDHEYGSNVIAIFDISSSNPDPIAMYELEYIDIGAVFGWSSNGQIIAVAQYDRNGLILYYLFPENGVVEKSLYRTSRLNCVTDGQWSPTEQMITFAGENEATAGWDIFLEEVASPGRKDGSVTNLTTTPQEDELDVSWSPDGYQIAYTKGYIDTAGNLRQELFVVRLSDASRTPIQLTSTLDEFETNPVWISEDEIAYLSWLPLEVVWSLNTVTITEIDPGPKRIMEIPQSWYK